MILFLVKSVLGLIFMLFMLYICAAMTYAVVITYWQFFAICLAVYAFFRFTRQTGNAHGTTAKDLEPVRASASTGPGSSGR